LLKEGQAHINAGAGLVADSDPVAEYEETRSKAFAVASAVEWALRLENELNHEPPNHGESLS
jgi:anthranilate synthase component I